MERRVGMRSQRSAKMHPSIGRCYQPWYDPKEIGRLSDFRSFDKSPPLWFFDVSVCRRHPARDQLQLANRAPAVHIVSSKYVVCREATRKHEMAHDHF
jgi:hypothetical protein